MWSLTPGSQCHWRRHGAMMPGCDNMTEGDMWQSSSPCQAPGAPSSDAWCLHATADATFHTRHLIFSSLGAATGDWLLLSGSDEYSVARFLSLIPHKQIIQNTDSRLDEGVTKIFWNDFNLLHNIIDRLYHCFWPDLWCFLPPNLLRCHDASACHEISPWQGREGGHGRGPL